MRSRWFGWALLVLAACEPLPPSTPVAAPPLAASVAQPAPLRRSVFAPPKHTGAALSLTASDGTGLRLVSLRSRSVVGDPLAFTELHLVFENPQNRTLEGTFRITLPSGASVSRLSMKMEDHWQEGEVVETQVARQVYEDFLHRRQDPALLEQAAGNEFSARVFPIPASGRKELVISYSQELAERREPFRLPLGGLPQIERAEAEVYGDEGKLLGAFRQERSQPEGDFVVELTDQDRSAGLRSGELVVARVTPIAGTEADPFGATLILLDTSASRALGFEAQLLAVDKLVRRIAQQSGGGTPVAVVAFDQNRETIYEGPASGYGAEARSRLQGRGALGASDVRAALQDAGRAAQEHGWKRLVLVSDGVATAGDSEAAHLREQVAALRTSGVERLDVIAVGGIRDDALLKQLTTAGLDRDGAVADSALSEEQLWHRLSNRTHSKIPVRVEGARWWYPNRLDGVQSGDEVLVYAEVPASQGTVSVSLGGRTVTPVLASAERPLLERSLVRAKINELLSSKTSPEVRQQVIELSTRHRVLSPFTSMLVLETEQDYERYHLDRKALSDVLMVQQGKLSVAGRTTPPESLDLPVKEVPKPEVAQEHSRLDSDGDGSAASAQGAVTNAPPAPPALPAPTAAPATQRPPSQTRSAPPDAPLTTPPRPDPKPTADKSDATSARGNMWGENIGESFGAGGLGLSGIGEGGGLGTIGRGAGIGQGQGFGSGHGRLGGDHKSPSPVVRMGATTVNGRLPPEVIQRIVRQNFGRFRLCYEQGLRRNPNLQGRVAVRFVIGKDGAVVMAVPGNSNLPDSNVVSCVANAFRPLRFPAPEGGIVTVVFPISFAPPGGSIADSPSVASPQEQEKPAAATPYSGRFGAVMKTLERDPKAALSDALSWHSQQPADVLSLLAVGESYERLHAPVSAARAYGSLIDLFPARADFRRYVAGRMENLDKSTLPLALDSLKKAKEQRPDHPSSHRMLAIALLRSGHHEEAFQALVEGLSRGYPPGRFLGYDRILREDLGLVAAAWKKAAPDRRAEIDRRLKEAKGSAEQGPSLRFVLTWETDNNDVDFHIYDNKGGHAFYGRPKLSSGGELYADVTTGYGPECFTVRKPPSQRPEYTLQAHYYSRGPMGYGMGKLEIIEHDGQGGLTFEERPFVIMQDHAYIDLGKVSKLSPRAP